MRPGNHHSPPSSPSPTRPAEWRIVSPSLVPATLFSRRKFWAERFGTAPVLPMSRAEMDTLGWDSCDVVLVSGDAYVDHPSFGAALIGRLLEAQGFRVGIIAQPDWRSPEPFAALGRPNVMFGITAGNMDSMVNRYTADKRLRSDDAYSPGGMGGKRPDRAVTVYARRCREAFGDVPIVIGGIEASLRRIAHFDYWSDEVHRSILVDARADLLLYGNAERAVVEVAHRLGAGEAPDSITDVRGTVFFRRGLPDGWTEIDSRTVDEPGPIASPPNPYQDATALDKQGGAGSNIANAHDATVVEGNAGTTRPCAATGAPGTGGVAATETLIPLRGLVGRQRLNRERTVIRLPDFDAVARDRVLYAHASRILHTESNPGNARALVQRHGQRDVWVNPPPVPLSTPEMDRVYELPYTRRPHPAYTAAPAVRGARAAPTSATVATAGDAKIPAYEMIRFSITIMRGCFGGCTFCSITEHEGRIIQNRSEGSVLREIAEVRDNVPGFTGVISDLGGPTANMYRLACKSPEVEAACRRPSCVYPGICSNLNTDHSSLIGLYRKARALPGIKKILVASGLRYDLAATSPEYVKELATHHVGGYLKIAPEHTEAGPLSKMLKPGIGSYEKFKALFDKYSREAGKEQYLIPYFIAAHPGTTDEDMLELSLWLKRSGFRADQVQAFLPSPMATATAMYHTGMNPLRPVRRRGGEAVHVPRGLKVRRLHKAFLRYHDPENWAFLRAALRRMGRADLIGGGKHQLIPLHQPAMGTAPRSMLRRDFRTQHTGLPPLPVARAPHRRPR